MAALCTQKRTGMEGEKDLLQLIKAVHNRASRCLKAGQIIVSPADQHAPGAELLSQLRIGGHVPHQDRVIARQAKARHVLAGNIRLFSSALIRAAVNGADGGLEVPALVESPSASHWARRDGA